jgi:hypothetical protein
MTMKTPTKKTPTKRNAAKRKPKSARSAKRKRRNTRNTVMTITRVVQAPETASADPQMSISARAGARNGARETTQEGTRAVAGDVSRHVTVKNKATAEEGSSRSMGRSRVMVVDARSMEVVAVVKSDLDTVAVVARSMEVESSMVIRGGRRAMVRSSNSTALEACREDLTSHSKAVMEVNKVVMEVSKEGMETRATVVGGMSRLTNSLVSGGMDICT